MANPSKRLACKIIKQAVEDATGGNQESLDWLSGDDSDSVFHDAQKNKESTLRKVRRIIIERRNIETDT